MSIGFNVDIDLIAISTSGVWYMCTIILQIYAC